MDNKEYLADYFHNLMCVIDKEEKENEMDSSLIKKEEVKMDTEVSNAENKSEMSTVEKKKRGRPKGSKNKPKVVALEPVTVVNELPGIEVESTNQEPSTEVVKKKRGRPKGSKNKPKVNTVDTVTISDEVAKTL